MRRLSKEGTPFSFAFMSYDSSRGSTEGIVRVRSARLLMRENVTYNRNAEIQERYLNLDTMQSRRFWHPLLMYFNDEKISI